MNNKDVIVVRREDFERLDKLFERAIYLIQNEWGYSRERAMSWLMDDDEWTDINLNKP